MNWLGIDLGQPLGEASRATMDNETIREVSKATQEVAKTTKAGIDATTGLARFAAGLVRESLDALFGIFSDRLRYVRWERQIRLRERMEQVMAERNLQNRFEPVAPKLALPILENASLEEDDSLQDLWVNLLIAAADPEKKGKVRAAFIDVIKQLEPVDAKVLHWIYEISCKHADEFNTPRNDGVETYGGPATPDGIRIDTSDVQEHLGISEQPLHISLDNLMRVRCVASYVEEEDVDTKAQFSGDSTHTTVTRDYGYSEVVLTPFGLAFVETCM